MRSLIVLVFLAAISSCSDKPKGFGNITGNIYWKYNNAQGNRPDAGCRIYLYSVDDSTFKETTQSDVRGDYKFEKIPAGKYFLIIKSFNTRDNADGHIDVINEYRKEIEDFTNEKFPVIYDTLFNKYKLFKDSSHNLLMGITETNYEPIMNKNLILDDSANKYARLMIDTLPSIIKVFTGVASEYSNKIEFHNITVEKDKTVNKITDFNITFL